MKDKYDDIHNQISSCELRNRLLVCLGKVEKPYEYDENYHTYFKRIVVEDVAVYLKQGIDNYVLPLTLNNKEK